MLVQLCLILPLGNDHIPSHCDLSWSICQYSKALLSIFTFFQCLQFFSIFTLTFTLAHLNVHLDFFQCLQFSPGLSVCSHCPGCLSALTWCSPLIDCLAGCSFDQLKYFLVLFWFVFVFFVCSLFVCLFVCLLADSDQSPGKGLQWDSLAPSLLRSTPGGNVYQNENVENKVGNEMGEKGRWAHPFTHDLNSSWRKRSSYISGRTKKDLGIFGDKVDNSSDGEAHGSFTRSLKHQRSNSTTWPILPALKKI